MPVPETKKRKWKRRVMGESKYICVHYWLKTNFGKASKCEHCQTKEKKRFEWALVTGKEYERKRDNFIQLCPSCHRKYDFNDNMRDCKRAVIMIDPISLQETLCESMTKASELAGVTRRAIRQALIRTQKSGGFLWKYPQK